MTPILIGRTLFWRVKKPQRREHSQIQAIKYVYDLHYILYGEMIARNQESVEFQQATNECCNLYVETWLKWFWPNECYYEGEG